MTNTSFCTQNAIIGHMVTESARALLHAHLYGCSVKAWSVNLRCIDV